jgi:hypothetical protein
MRNEAHRHLAIDAYSAYESRLLDVRSFALSAFSRESYLPSEDLSRHVYVLRLGANEGKHPSIAAIPNRADPLSVLYIGGHESGRSTGRYNALLESCRAAEARFAKHGHAWNDMAYSHPVAQSLTTSLLTHGFRISDCVIDLLSGESNYDELEFLIGYQERFHHLPPWNAVRKGASAFVA